MNFRCHYLVTSDCSCYTINANAYQKLRLVVQLLEGDIIVPRGRENWIPQEFASHLNVFNFPKTLTKGFALRIFTPILILYAIYKNKNRGGRGCEWLYAPTNELSYFGVWLAQLLFGCGFYLFCWDPPGVKIRDSEKMIHRIRRRLIDVFFVKTIMRSSRLIMNLNIGFIDSVFGEKCKIKDKILSFPNGTDVMHIMSTVRQVSHVRKKIGINSVFEVDKGCWQIVELINRLYKRDKSISIVWCGGGVLQNAVRDKIISSGVPAEKLEVCGFLPFEDAVVALASCDIALNWYLDLPSLRWNYVLKAPEFMSLGLPIVSSDLVGIHEYVEDNKNGVLFSAGNVDEAEEKVSALLSDEELIDEMRKETLKRVMQYDWRAINDDIRKGILGENNTCDK